LPHDQVKLLVVVLVSGATWACADRTLPPIERQAFVLRVSKSFKEPPSNSDLAAIITALDAQVHADIFALLSRH
jgi:hypothetical protein